MNSLAKYISYVFSPFAVGPLVIAITSFLISNTILEALLWILVFVLVLLVPGFLYIYVLVKRGVITDIHVRNRKQRDNIYILGLILVLLTLGTYYFLNAPAEILAVMISVILSFTFSAVINKKIKISLHTVSMVGAAVVFYFLIGPTAFLITLFLTILVIWARIKIKDHTFVETMLGIIVPAIITVLVFEHIVI